MAAHAAPETQPCGLQARRARTRSDGSPKGVVTTRSSRTLVSPGIAYSPLPPIIPISAVARSAPAPIAFLAEVLSGRGAKHQAASISSLALLSVRGAGSESVAAFTMPAGDSTRIRSSKPGSSERHILRRPPAICPGAVARSADTRHPYPAASGQVAAESLDDDNSLCPSENRVAFVGLYRPLPMGASFSSAAHARILRVVQAGARTHGQTTVPNSLSSTRVKIDQASDAVSFSLPASLPTRAAPRSKCRHPTSALSRIASRNPPSD